MSVRGMAAMMGIVTSLSVSCRRAGPTHESSEVAREPERAYQAPGDAGPAVRMHDGPGAAPRPSGSVDAAGQTAPDTRCVANELDIFRFLSSLPEAEARKRYIAARGVPDKTRMIIYHRGEKGCSPIDPQPCDWVFMVVGPLFGAQYSVDPFNRHVRMVDGRPYDEWCRDARVSYSKWWPKDRDCTEANAHATDPISPDAGVCSDP
jgi:hypothetical protein